MTGTTRTPTEARKTVAHQVAQQVAQGLDQQTASVIVAQRHGIEAKAAFNCYREQVTA